MDLSRVEFEHKFVKNLNDEDSKKELLDFFDNYSELQKQIVNLKKLSTNYQQERDDCFEEIENVMLENHGSSYVESRGAPYNGNETIFTD